jgi:hypothetical protein
MEIRFCKRKVLNNQKPLKEEYKNRIASSSRLHSLTIRGEQQ